ncbi:hypothetical protein [Pedobacter aquatilis]|uniref:glycosyl-4,4'-diaponeurosporenoate acyltransferase CrtO family protein n=1 Tax=Pedobacter aquatilis TaxID=351343 RepID=UPI00292D0618|nr:hypothetical protein [Pedobacter aquatilis]
MKVINQLINFFWTLIAFFPIIVLWNQHWHIGYFITISCLSILIGFTPLSYFVISKTTKSYQKIGVGHVLLFVQDGKIAKRFAGKNRKNLTAKLNIKSLILRTVVQERFHLVCLFFFLGSMSYAMALKLFYLSIWLLITNIFYNFYPVLLQQYIRLRLKKINKSNPPDLRLNKS